MGSTLEQLPSVSIRDLSRSPGDVLDRVAAGARFLVCRHGEPLATLQPLDGYVFQPFDGTAHDVFGWPIGGITDEIAKLSRTLRDCYRQWRLRPARLPYDLRVNTRAMMEDLAVRGLAKRTDCGWEPTGRGLAMHEALQGRR